MVTVRCKCGFKGGIAETVTEAYCPRCFRQIELEVDDNPASHFCDSDPYPHPKLEAE